MSNHEFAAFIGGMVVGAIITAIGSLYVAGRHCSELASISESFARRISNGR